MKTLNPRQRPFTDIDAIRYAHRFTDVNLNFLTKGAAALLDKVINWCKTKLASKPEPKQKKQVGKIMKFMTSARKNVEKIIRNPEQRSQAISLASNAKDAVKAGMSLATAIGGGAALGLGPISALAIPAFKATQGIMWFYKKKKQEEKNKGIKGFFRRLGKRAKNVGKALTGKVEL